MAESVILEIVNQVITLAQAISPVGIDALAFFVSFFLVFAISFASTAMIPTFKDTPEVNKKAIRVIISLAIAYFSATSPIVANSIQKVFPSIGILVIGSAAFMITVYFVFPDVKTASNIVTFIIGPLIIGVLCLILWGAITQWETPMFEQHPEGIMLAGFLISNYDIGIILLIGGAIAFILFSTKTSGNKRLVDDLLFDKIFNR